MHWIKELNVSITVSDRDGKIIEMNEQAEKEFASAGGLDLIGKNLKECHPKSANEQMDRMMNEKKTNTYMIEYPDVNKLIYQTPWTIDGECKGLIEMSIVLPKDIEIKSS